MIFKYFSGIMKKVCKFLIAAIALFSLCLTMSTVLLAGPEDESTVTEGGADDNCVYQTMSHCPGAGLNYSCKMSSTSELCRRHACCQPF